MSAKKNFLFSTMFVLVALLATFVFLRGTSKADPGIPNTPESHQIRATLTRAYELMGIAARTFDVSAFPTVFVDTPDYRLSDQQRETIRQVLGSEAAEKGGYLTAMQAYYISWGKGAAALEIALEKARAENRSLTADEMQEIIKANGGQVPTLARQDPVSVTQLEFRSIKIEGDRAVVQYDDGAALQEAVLVKIGGQWFIASIKPIWVHY